MLQKASQESRAVVPLSGPFAPLAVVLALDRTTKDKCVMGRRQHPQHRVGISVEVAIAIAPDTQGL